ncbi:MAG: hypothetical protein JST32_08300 [Bacteroidetes bacterium]|nr:hypothetical protein [Bacteroidota bacterium]
MNHLLMAAVSLIWLNAPAQQNDPVAGTWRGTSKCQIQGSACNDEAAVYYASKIPGHNSYRFKMDKIVNGKDEAMGTLLFEMNYATRTLTAVNKSARGKGYWTFKVSGNTIHGTLTIDKKKLYRVIDLTRDK